MDTISVRSLSGLHLAYELNKMMFGHAQFLPLLRVIRTWVKVRAIGSYVYGFPASIAWTIMVVYICRRLGDNRNAQDGRDLMPILTPVFPNKNAAFTVRQATRKIVTDELIRAETMLTCGSNETGGGLSKQWCMKANSLHTPRREVFQFRVYVSYPCNYFVVPYSARDIVSDVLRGSGTWEKLFERYDLRDHHRPVWRVAQPPVTPATSSHSILCPSLINRHFLLLTLQTTSKEELVVVGGLVDSRLRDLAQTLEDEQYIRSARIAPVQESPGTNQSNASCKQLRRQWLIGMDIESAPRLPDGTRSRRNVDITGCLSTFYQILRERDAFTDFGEKLTHVYLNRSQAMQLIL
ncbi:hypothetical protein T265_06856 [Opisthorchis viverrini]|uniref:polynucleotide adenylyltransferase n=1 Tax=Opisthorchis viverrini TaxID=6198 RepID=A0A075AD03_OPIVI|nr:hypothetical protein T265_06856 [Opisthorchis viverrini]KER25754.1 hypothetical protein T265_06856 [Opisthorchis viverrini]